MIAGRYTRGHEIGRGGMGAVWLGRDEVLGRTVAIKRVGLMPGSDDGADVARAEREAKIAASLNHPHIVGVYDLVAEDGEQWMVMEYVEGTTLSGLVRTKGPLHPDEAAPIIAQAASALAAAHANGVVHRDVKPSNILVREDGHVKLTDFGIARGRSDATLTQTGLVTGSPAYLAPEIASGQQATSASDVWSLGATLFHALAGFPPYDASDNVLGALYRIVNETPPQVDDAGALAPLLEATMTRAPEQRWTMEDICRFLATGELGHPQLPRLAPTPPGATSTLHVVPDMSGIPPIVADPTPPAPGPEPSDEPHRRRLLPAVIALIVAALVAAIVVLALQDDPQDNLALDPQATDSSSPAASPSEATDPSEATSEPPSKPSRKDLKAFIGSYLSLASSDPQRGFELLTRSFQRQSPSYEEFWSSVSSPQVVSFSADPAALTVSYTYRYQREGLGEQEDAVRLQLVEVADGFLIDGES